MKTSLTAFGALLIILAIFFFRSQGYVGDVPSYAATNAFHETDFTVGQGEWKLPGTLTLPSHGRGPWPAIVLVHGSGPEDRDESMGSPNKPFRDLAWGLATRGIAVLRYEKRTMQYGERLRKTPPQNFTVREETVDDALRAIAQLRTNKVIDPNHIFVLGHSMGGMLAPKIGQMDTNLAGLILLAGSNRRFEDFIVEQTRYLISLNGTPTAEAKAYLEKTQADADSLRKLTAADLASPIILFGAQPYYWLDLRNYDPLGAAKQLKQPLLVLQGDRDYQVTQSDFNRWKEALASRSNVTFKLYPKLNHQFIAGDGKSTPDEYQQSGHVAGPVVTDIAEWIKSH